MCHLSTHLVFNHLIKDFHRVSNRRAKVDSNDLMFVLELHRAVLDSCDPSFLDLLGNLTLNYLEFREEFPVDFPQKTASSFTSDLPIVPIIVSMPSKIAYSMGFLPFDLLLESPPTLPHSNCTCDLIGRSLAK